jgi:tetratricopeptide (TPR) repeat protein
MHIHKKNTALAKNELALSDDTKIITPLNYIAHGLIASSEGKLDEAFELLNSAIKIDPNLYFIYQVIGSTLLTNTQDYNESVLFLKKAKELGGDNWAIHWNLAVAYNNLRRTYSAFQEAILSYFSKPTKDGLKFIYANAPILIRTLIFIVFLTGLSGIFIFPATTIGVAATVTTLLIAELIRYIFTNNRSSLILIGLYLTLATVYYLVFVR